jgi:hypothetical protein
VEHIPDYEGCMLSKAHAQIIELEERIMKAEKAMAKAYAWPNEGDPRTEHVKASFREYREKYPEAYTN